ncbi:MAG: TPM domain-containing protein [Proteobacteria bacterium]|nr:TPM domain-containing protein [Pseudomonadota bacterium]
MAQALFKRAALALAIVFAFAGAAVAAPTFPQLTGRVVDDAHILSPDVQAQLTQKLADLEQRTSRQLVVVTLPSLQGYEIEDYGYQLGRAWGIGQKKLDNGALFIIAPNERRVRIEVGYGLEPVLTDALSSVILQTKVLPRFKAGDMSGGIVDGTNAIVEQLLLDAPAAKARVAEAEKQAKDRDSDDPFTAIFVFIVIMIVVSRIFRRGGGGLGVLPWIILGSMGGRGGWGDGGGFGGGGGFSGGGGSFGGGGSSGSW